MKKFILLSALVLSACATQDKRVDTVIATDSNGNPMQVRRSMSQKEFISQQEAQHKIAGDTALAHSYSECMASYYKFKGEEALNTPNDIGAIAVKAMAEALVSQNQPNVAPCSGLGANSNDVKINAENAKVRKHEVWVNGGVKALPWVGGVLLGKEIVGSVADLATAGIKAAGNKTTINGNGNSANATSQHADNQSTIADSGNYTEAGGIPLAEGEVAPVALGTAESSESSLCPEGTTQRPGNEEDDPATIVEGITCSTNDGGTVAPSG